MYLIKLPGSVDCSVVFSVIPPYNPTVACSDIGVQRIEPQHAVGGIVTTSDGLGRAANCV